MCVCSFVFVREKRRIEGKNLPAREKERLNRESDGGDTGSTGGGPYMAGEHIGFDFSLYRNNDIDNLNLRTIVSAPTKKMFPPETPISYFCLLFKLMTHRVLRVQQRHLWLMFGFVADKKSKPDPYR